MGGGGQVDWVGGFWGIGMGRWVDCVGGWTG